MKKVLTTLILVFIVNVIYSQDLIVTIDGDSINANISSIENNYVYFTYFEKNSNFKTVLPSEKVQNFNYGFYRPDFESIGEFVGLKNYNHFRVALNVGYGYQTAPLADDVPDDFKSYIKRLKSGFHIGGDLTYYFTEVLGIGMKYNRFITSNYMEHIYIVDEYDNTRYGEMKDDVAITFIAPTFSTRFINQKKSGALYLNTSFGYVDYNNAKIIVDPYIYTGKTVGFAFDFGYDLLSLKSVTLGFQVSYFMASLSKFNVYDGTDVTTVKLEGFYEGLNRLDFSLGLRFNK